ncbi:MAG TPA: hypothetical protein VL463_01100 [Kofleriaceae bacterium]|nr:hypothetical protein [Kofleriaceae bacterium]
MARWAAIALVLCSCGPTTPAARRDWPAWLSAARPEPAYPPRLDAPDDATCRQRVAKLRDRFHGWDVQTDPLCLAIRASRTAGHGDARLTTGEVDELREVLLANPELFGLPFGAAPSEDITDLAGVGTIVSWTQDLAKTSAILVGARAHESADHFDTPAGPHRADVPRTIAIEGHFLPLVFPSTPARKSNAELLAPFDGRPLYAMWSSRGPCESDQGGSGFGGRVESLDVKGTINAYRGVLVIVRPSSIELRDVVHFLPVGAFHAGGQTFRCATTRERERDGYRSSVPLGFVVDARTGEDLTDVAPPWTYEGWYGMSPYRPIDLTNDGFFTSTLPWPSFELPAASPPA